MKTTSLPLWLLAATLITVPALADEAKPASDAKRAEMLRKYDKNGDGKIDDSERAAARMEMRSGSDKEKGDRRKQWLKRFDKNGDGQLDDAERAEAEKARENLAQNREKRQQMLLEKFDKDGDGVLNDEERAAAKEKADAMADRMPERRKDRKK